MLDTKKCYVCKKILEIAKFHKDSSRGDGLNHRCKECHHREREARQKRTPERARALRVKYRYGISTELYAEMIKDGCNACGSMERLVVDHDHACCNTAPICGNCIRGILCYDCNVAEGFLRGDVKRFELLMAYIKKHQNDA